LGIHLFLILYGKEKVACRLAGKSPGIMKEYGLAEISRMNNAGSRQTMRFKRLVNKLFLTAFVVVSFSLYAIQKSFSNPELKGNASAQLPNPRVSQQLLPTSATGSESGQVAAATAPSAVTDPAASSEQVIAPTATSAPLPAAAASLYKDGTYTGGQVDAFYGIVQVQTVIQNGKITNVIPLNYPQDRRTSARINSIAIPYLQQEVIQAQNANVDIISGATLTSQAFEISLQSALDKARN
jgi:uncharacterized protein with FMN-binding domain